ncbi:MAG: phosphatase PAP2 family protein [Bacteroidia bacterium]
MRKLFLIAIAFYAFILKAQPTEVKILSSIYNDSSALKISGAKFLSHSVAPISAAVPFTILVSGIIKKDSALIDKGIKATVAFGLNAIVTECAKYSANRRRPFNSYPELFHAKSKVEDLSMPSGHTSNAFAAATSLSLTCKKWYVTVPAYGWACGVAYSRMQLGVHYPSDVLMGALIGTASSFLSFKIEKWMNRKSSSKDENTPSF